MYNNNFQIIVTETKTSKTFIYYFETIEEAKHAKRKIEEGGNRAKIKKVRR